MSLKRLMATSVAVTACAWLLTSCGGGGGGGYGGGGSTGPTAPPDPGWTSGSFSPPANFAAYCAVPRTGVDPATSMAYPDKLGSIDWENNWIRAWTNAYYLWYSEVVDANPADSATTAAYFDLMKTTATTPSGTPKDKFHFTYQTSTWEQLSQSDVSIGYGVAWALIAVTPPRKLLVAYVDASTPASTAMLERGASVLKIDGVDLVNANDQASIDTLNAGISPTATGQSHTFVVEDVPGGAQRTITMVSANINENPVPTYASFPQAGGGVVGYIEFNAHVAPAETDLITAFTHLAAAGVTDLVLDIRYNGGGYLDIASEVAYMVAGPGPTTGATFEKESFNAKYPTTNPITGQALTPTPFWSVAQGFSATAGQALPHLDLPRVFVLTSASTCSASEAIINGLRGVNVTVIQVGSTTCGKPYGFYPQDNCGTTYFSIQFMGVNNADFGGYPDGFTPANSSSTVGFMIPGCGVADDYTHNLGDPAEAQFAAALGYINNAATCPTPSAISPGAPVARLLRPEALMSRILRRPR
jgi:carboxyl-terminal processing protease